MNAIVQAYKDGQVQGIYFGRQDNTVCARWQAGGAMLEAYAEVDDCWEGEAPNEEYRLRSVQFTRGWVCSADGERLLGDLSAAEDGQAVEEIIAEQLAYDKQETTYKW